MFLFMSLSLSLSAFDRSFYVYFCMFPVCPLCCFIVISMDPVSEINDDDDDILHGPPTGIPRPYRFSFSLFFSFSVHAVD